MVVFEILYLAFTILFAAINAMWIKEGKHINHTINGLIHLAAAVTAAFVWWIPAFVIILCNANVIFSISLNIFRGLPINYVSLNPESIIDKVERKIFGSDFYTPKIVYLIISLSLNAIYLFK